MGTASFLMSASTELWYSGSWLATKSSPCVARVEPFPNHSKPSHTVGRGEARIPRDFDLAGLGTGGIHLGLKPGARDRFADERTPPRRAVAWPNHRGALRALLSYSKTRPGSYGLGIPRIFSKDENDPAGASVRAIDDAQ